MRLIDGDKLIQSICNTADLGGWIGDTLLQIKKLAINYIHSAPSIDIVRCGECKHWIDDRKSEADMGTCGLTHYFTNTDDFCSYGVQIDECEKEYRELGLYELRELRQADERSNDE